ncbi:unnamed protein product [Prorocentrum cordatum]|uniref:Uncharacterized protein n=1 Tax=Prorocentrum cordatum TaxID=2364126 RepID=A0ABN9TJB7_9DINO|nr:unnamed protein product [Polarella glacialis]
MTRAPILKDATRARDGTGKVPAKRRDSAGEPQRLLSSRREEEGKEERAEDPCRSEGRGEARRGGRREVTLRLEAPSTVAPRRTSDLAHPKQSVRRLWML